MITFSILSGLLGYTFMSFNMIMFRKKWPLGSIKRGYVHPFHPLPAIVLLLLCCASPTSRCSSATARSSWR